LALCEINLFYKKKIKTDFYLNRCLYIIYSVMTDIINNNEDFITKILENIQRVTLEEFDKGGFQEKVVEKRVKKKNNKGDMMLNFHRNQIMQNCYQKVKNNEKKGINKVVDSVEEENVNILSDTNIFNIVVDKSKLVDWKKLEKEVQINKVKEFLTKKEIILEEDVEEELFSLINSGKIKSKKYIEYDSILERILVMPIISFDEKLDKYKVNYSTQKKKKKKKISFK